MWPILFRIGPVTLHTYGLMVALGFLAAFAAARSQFVRRGLPVTDLDELTFFMMMAGLLGARLLFFGVDGFVELKSDPFSFFRIWEGGLVFYGGVIGGLIALTIYAIVKRQRFLDLTDAFVPPLFIGHAIGRLGCLSAGCCYGKPTDSALSIVFRNAESLAPKFIPLYPTQIYESLANFTFFLAFLWYARRRPPTGAMTAGYLLVYGVFRFLIEFLRGDDRGAFIGGFSPSQVIAMGLIAVGLGLAGYVRLHRHVHA